MQLRNSRFRRCQKRWVPQDPAHIMLAHVGVDAPPLGSIPRTPLVVPAGVIPQDVRAGLAEKIDVTKVERKSPSPIVGARGASFTYPRFRPVDGPTCFGE